MEKGLTKQRIIAELTRSVHSGSDTEKLKAYLPVASAAALEDPDFLAHLIAWNEKHGQVRDAKVALPVCHLKQLRTDSAPEYTQNALAHLALLDPRNYVRALKFAEEVKVTGHGKALVRLTERYLRAREANLGWWLRTVMQHRASLKRLYATYHIKPSPLCDQVLFKGYRPAGSNLEAVASLGTLSTQDAALAVIKHRIPFLIAVQALGGEKAKSEDFVMALIMQMSPTEVVTNSQLLQKLGVRENPALRAAYDDAMAKVAKSKQALLKTTRAAQTVTDATLKARLTGAQEKQIAQVAVKGNWLVLGDKSSSMQRAVETAKLVAATLAKFVEGEVHLVFFDTSPHHVDVSGKSYEEVLALTSRVRASGATSIGCGLRYAMERQWDLQGIAIVSDGAENSAPLFHSTYDRLVQQTGFDLPVYLYWLECEQPNSYNNNPEALARNMATLGHELQVFDLRDTEVDMYSLPNLVTTMRAGRYALLDEILAVPLLTLAEVFKQPEVENEDAA